MTGVMLLDALRTNTNDAASRAAVACLEEWQRAFPILAKLRPDMRMRDLQQVLATTQRQLLQFVRADLSGRPLIVLDPPAVGLDDLTYYRLGDFLAEKWADRAIILLSSLRKWDKESHRWIQIEKSTVKG